MTFDEKYLNKIICGDSLTMMREMPVALIDRIISSTKVQLILNFISSGTTNIAAVKMIMI